MDEDFRTWVILVHNVQPRYLEISMNHLNHLPPEGLVGLSISMVRSTVGPHLLRSVSIDSRKTRGNVNTAWHEVVQAVSPHIGQAPLVFIGLNYGEDVLKHGFIDMAGSNEWTDGCAEVIRQTEELYFVDSRGAFIPQLPQLQLWKPSFDRIHQGGPWLHLPDRMAGTHQNARSPKTLCTPYDKPKSASSTTSSDASEQCQQFEHDKLGQSSSDMSTDSYDNEFQAVDTLQPSINWKYALEVMDNLQVACRQGEYSHAQDELAKLLLWTAQGQYPEAQVDIAVCHAEACLATGQHEEALTVLYQTRERLDEIAPKTSDQTTFNEKYEEMRSILPSVEGIIRYHQGRYKEAIVLLDKPFPALRVGTEHSFLSARRRRHITLWAKRVLAMALTKVRNERALKVIDELKNDLALIGSAQSWSYFNEMALERALLDYTVAFCKVSLGDFTSALRLSQRSTDVLERHCYFLEFPLLEALALTFAVHVHMHHPETQSIWENLSPRISWNPPFKHPLRCEIEASQFLHHQVGGEYKEALLSIRWILENLRQAHGKTQETHSETLTMKRNLAIVLLDLGRFKEAEKVLLECLVISETKARSGNCDFRSDAMDWAYLAKARFLTGSIPEAKILIIWALQDLARGPWSPSGNVRPRESLVMQGPTESIRELSVRQSVLEPATRSFRIDSILGKLIRTPHQEAQLDLLEALGIYADIESQSRESGSQNTRARLRKIVADKLQQKLGDRHPRTFKARLDLYLTDNLPDEALLDQYLESLATLHDDLLYSLPKCYAYRFQAKSQLVLAILPCRDPEDPVPEDLKRDLQFQRAIYSFQTLTLDQSHPETLRSMWALLQSGDIGQVGHKEFEDYLQRVRDPECREQRLRWSLQREAALAKLLEERGESKQAIAINQAILRTIDAADPKKPNIRGVGHDENVSCLSEREFDAIALGELREQVARSIPQPSKRS